jgi:hypothetical protein
MTLPVGQPLMYMNLHPLAPMSDYELRIATQHIGAWGSRVRNPGEPPRSFVATIWGEYFDAAETLAELDAIMGYSP